MYWKSVAAFPLLEAVINIDSLLFFNVLAKEFQYRLLISSTVSNTIDLSTGVFSIISKRM